MSPKKKILASGTTALLLGVAAAGAMWWLSTQDTSPETEKVLQWLKAVDEGHTVKAVKLASQLVPDPSDTVKPAYRKLASEHGVPPEFLTTSFNVWDFQRWQSALRFKQLSVKLTENHPDDPEPLFQAVSSRLKPREMPDTHLPWPIRIWNEKAGHCDRQAWVLCELAYQQGWQTQIVYLREADDNTSSHTVAELRKGDSVCTADPYKEVLIKGQSIRRLASHKNLVESHWPNADAIWPEISNAIMWMPAYPQDYAPRNQKLNEVLKRHLGKKRPRFGEDPQKRLRRYQQRSRDTESDVDPMPTRLWFYPFRLLNAGFRKAQENTPPHENNRHTAESEP